LPEDSPGWTFGWIGIYHSYLLQRVKAQVAASGLTLQVPSVEELAADYGMSRSHFSHFFRERTGLTPAHFVTETRVRRTALMLVQSRAPLKKIADACGFANMNHFSKVFRRYQHISPAAYRRSIG
jgi:transcriptional regulator GlxA family with amidase domain